MPVQIILDTVADSSLILEGQTASKTRGGVATGLSGDPSTALEQVYDALVVLGFPLGHTMTINGAGIHFRSLEVKARESDTCPFRMLYDNSGLPPTAYVIKSRSYLQPFQTYLVPGTNEPLRVDWTNPDDAGDDVPEDNVTFNILQPVREVAVSGIKLGLNPPTTYEEAIGYTNDDNWRNQPRGHWLVTEGGSELSKYQGFYSWFASASTRPGRDWSETGTLFNTKTGRYVKVDPADYASLISDNDYAFGLITTVNGALRWGPFQTTSFFGLFGF